MKKVNILKNIEDAGVISVVRADTSEKAMKIVDAVIAGGVRGIEVTFTIPNADRLIGELVNKYKNTDAVIGAGTVLDSTTARMAIIAGAQYIVSPAFDQETAEICNLYQIPYLAGCLTITEVTNAMRAGVDIVKLFPGSQAGAETVKAIKAPLPQANIMPTGGVNLENMKDWFAAGVIAVGAGSAMLKPADNNDFAEVTNVATEYVKELNRIRNNKKA